MIQVDKYVILQHSGFYFAVSEEKTLCPVCNTVLTVRDSRKRKVKDASGKEYIFKLRRLYCACCRKIHLEIPDCIQSNKHYFRETISAVIEDSIEYCAADDSTIRRWRRGK